MPPLKRIVTSPTFQEAVGAVAAAYLRLAWRTSRVTLEPSGIYDSVEMPAIIAMWHGQHFMAPFIKRKDPRHHGFTQRPGAPVGSFASVRLRCS